ncbi:potassium channel family protein [Thiohalorhabdus sp. Cl-TMA]|uniref:Potassium channel family protein n=1 Tax=Thiohalorhabdus methylotrophus TaxID=3242694 RepID=A0ABV4TTJ4_9GAMM
MRFTVEFLWNLGGMLGEGLPLLLGLMMIISLLSAAAGYREGWSFGNSLYFGFITALTIGYGDMRPVSGLGRALAVFIGLFGLITTGLVIAVAVEAASLTFQQLQGTTDYSKR